MSKPIDKQQAFERISQILGCKWSLHILDTLREHPTRPSAFLKSNDGLASRVLHRCLKRLEKDGLIKKVVFDEIPPHTEYILTAEGKRFYKIIESARSMAEEWIGTQRVVKL